MINQFEIDLKSYNEHLNKILEDTEKHLISYFEQIFNLRVGPMQLTLNEEDENSVDAVFDLCYDGMRFDEFVLLKLKFDCCNIYTASLEEKCISLIIGQSNDPFALNFNVDTTMSASEGNQAIFEDLKKRIRSRKIRC